ncbi:hypothetical protein VP01_675g3 [Puccinia sorghi]|uniref:Uncharacterized protein n=1 Tax=Puccinia sorghi TaxID=27349 RepID=A0A0L6UGT6_9BASI|nr:hypothetical protein VP01_675g3 [Puccinia sorghi]
MMSRIKITIFNKQHECEITLNKNFNHIETYLLFLETCHTFLKNCHMFLFLPKLLTKGKWKRPKVLMILNKAINKPHNANICMVQNTDSRYTTEYQGSQKNLDRLVSSSQRLHNRHKRLPFPPPLSFFSSAHSRFKLIQYLPPVTPTSVQPYMLSDLYPSSSCQKIPSNTLFHPPGTFMKTHVIRALVFQKHPCYPGLGSRGNLKHICLQALCVFLFYAHPLAIFIYVKNPQSFKKNIQNSKNLKKISISVFFSAINLNKMHLNKKTGQEILNGLYSFFLFTQKYSSQVQFYIKYSLMICCSVNQGPKQPLWMIVLSHCKLCQFSFKMPLGVQIPMEHLHSSCENLINLHCKQNLLNCLQLTCRNHCADCAVTVPKILHRTTCGVWMEAWLEIAACQLHAVDQVFCAVLIVPQSIIPENNFTISHLYQRSGKGKSSISLCSGSPPLVEMFGRHYDKCFDKSTWLVCAHILFPIETFLLLFLRISSLMKFLIDLFSESPEKNSKIKINTLLCVRRNHKPQQNQLNQLKNNLVKTIYHPPESLRPLMDVTKSPHLIDENHNNVRMWRGLTTSIISSFVFEFCFHMTFSCDTDFIDLKFEGSFVHFGALSLPDAKDMPCIYRRSKIVKELMERTLVGSSGLIGNIQIFEISSFLLIPEFHLIFSPSSILLHFIMVSLFSIHSGLKDFLIDYLLVILSMMCLLFNLSTATCSASFPKKEPQTFFSPIFGPFIRSTQSKFQHECSAGKFGCLSLGDHLWHFPGKCYCTGVPIGLVVSVLNVGCIKPIFMTEENGKCSGSNCPVIFLNGRYIATQHKNLIKKIDCRTIKISNYNKIIINIYFLHFLLNIKITFDKLIPLCEFDKLIKILIMKSTHKYIKI